MKYFLFFISLFLAINTFSQNTTGSRKKNNPAANSANAPKTRKKESGSEVAMEELILYNKSGSLEQKRQTEAPTHPKTKLDDLKNPFDSTKKVKPGVQSPKSQVKQKPYIGETEKN